MSIKQPRRPTTPPRRRPRVAGHGQRSGATLVEAPTSVTSAEPVEATTPAEPATSAEPVEAPTSAERTTSAEPVEAPRRRSALLHPPRRTQRWLLPLGGLTILAVAFGATSYAVTQKPADSASAQASANDAATTAAASAAQTILGYSYRTIDANIAAARTDMTAPFASTSLTPKLVSELRSLADQRKLVVKASVRSAAALECGEDCSTSTVRVLLFIDQDRTTAGKPTSAIPVRAVFTMTDQAGRWLVSNMVDF